MGQLLNILKEIKVVPNRITSDNVTNLFFEVRAEIFAVGKKTPNAYLLKEIENLYFKSNSFKNLKKHTLSKIWKKLQSIKDTLNEIKAKPPTPKLEIGGIYDIYFPAQGIVRKEMNYNGPNVYGDHLFYYSKASGPSEMDWTYITPENLHKYKIILSKIQEATYQKPITRMTHQDPDSGSTTWSVIYRPDLNGLINYLDRIIRKYRDLLKQNKLTRDKELTNNYELLKQVRRSLMDIVKVRYPELLDKINKNLEEIKEIKLQDIINKGNRL